MRSRNNAGLKACATLVLGLTVGACAHRTAPARPAPPALTTLQHDIDAVLAQPILAHGSWGVLVKSLKNDETLYSHNAGKLMMPASNMKIVTLAAAAEKLGWDYTYNTKLFAAGAVSTGVLNGDLVVSGNGDPSLVAADGMADRVFAEWAARLKQRGIRAIGGRVIGDDNGVEEPAPGMGWMWDDIPTEDSTSVGALNYNENALRVTVLPGPAAGDSAAISLSVGTSGLTVVNAVTTAAAGTTTSIDPHRLQGSTTLVLRGSIALGAAPSVLDVSVDNPTQFFASALRAGLIANGIDVRGAAVDIDDIADAPATSGAPVISYQSPPLSTLAVRLMKISQNLYAETLLKTLAAGPGTVPTAAAGWSVARTILERWDVPPGSLIQRDGSGLTRYDFVTPDALVAILAHVYRDARLRGPFEASLPIAGRDGTLANRMKGTSAEGNARAKTGSMTGVRGTSGYVTSAGGEPLVFSILANMYDSPASTITAAEDAIVVRLAQFRRDR